VLFCEILEWAGEDMIIQKQERKNSLFRLCIVDLGTIMGFLDKPNRTLNQLNRTSRAQF